MRGYYVMDVLDVLDAKRKIDAEDWLMTINIQSLQYMDEQESRKLLASLQQQAGYGTKSKPKFDEAGFEALKMRLKLGI